ncbi:MAG: RNA methyltransferase [Acidimicrobiia bacterium]|nr:RNA methyltransferase [Acidimicrobiia bacterium]
MEPVRSLRNPRVVDAARLHRARIRKELGLTLVEGPHVVGDAIRFGCQIPTIFALVEDPAADSLAETSGSVLVRVTQDVLTRLSGTDHPRGPVAVVRIPDSRRIEDRSAIVLWDVGDPGNVGTLIRSAAAFGYGVIATGSTADLWSPKVVRAAAAGHFATVLETAPALSVDGLRDRGFRCLALTADGTADLSTVPPGRMAVLVGDEASGLPVAVRQAADLTVAISMPGGMESLNAAVAGSIAMHALFNAAGRSTPAD